MNWLERISNFVTEKNAIIILASLFIIMSIAVTIVPYDPSTDLADATTNDIWVQQYANGVHYIPYDEWTYGQTQSVVVEYQGEYVVVNEKGPGHVVMMLPFYMLGIGGLFSIIVMGLAILGTYMLGKRLFSWQVGFIASLAVLFNLIVIVMWHRYYWTDASTMHLMVLALWLLVEGNYHYNGGSLNPEMKITPSSKDKILGMVFCILSGLAFGASVSTRYPTGLLILAFLAYLFGFYLLRTWPALKNKDFRKTFKDSLPMIIMFLAFAIGLFMVLIPLTQYNAEYFGGPFNSGYDATTLREFSQTGTIDVRNTTSSWISSLGSYISTAIGNFVKLLPTFISRMPALLFAPIGIYCLRRKKLELAILLLWIGINLFTYLSLEWVDMYAHTQLVPWEPRYWMPSLPAISILGGLGIYRLSKWLTRKLTQGNPWPDPEKRAVKILITGAIVGIIILWGAVPAANYLKDPVVQIGPHLPQAQLVTTDMLLASPQTYIETPVILEAAIITSVSHDSISIRSQNSSNPGSVRVRLVDWPSGTLPQFTVGQHVWLRGMFVLPPAPPGVITEFSIGVKYGIQDYVRLIP